MQNNKYLQKDKAVLVRTLKIGMKTILMAHMQIIARKYFLIKILKTLLKTLQNVLRYALSQEKRTHTLENKLKISLLPIHKMQTPLFCMQQEDYFKNYLF